MGNKEQPDATPFQDSQLLADIANRIHSTDLENSDRLLAISKSLETADASSGLETGGRDEGADVDALRSIARSLIHMVGVPPKEETAPSGPSGPAGDGSGASGAAGEAGASGAAGSASGPAAAPSEEAPSEEV